MKALQSLMCYTSPHHDAATTMGYYMDGNCERVMRAVITGIRAQEFQTLDSWFLLPGRYHMSGNVHLQNFVKTCVYAFFFFFLNDFKSTIFI